MQRYDCAAFVKIPDTVVVPCEQTQLHDVTAGRSHEQYD